MSPIFVLCFTALIAVAPASGRDNNLHQKKSNKPLLKLAKEIFRRSPKTSTEQFSFSQLLFNDDQSRALRDETLESVFIQGMASGTLNANYYGAYMVQDLAYLYNGVNAYNNAAEIMRRTGESDFEQFYRNESSKWDSGYLVPSLEDWHLENTENVKPSIAARDYMSFLTTVSLEKPKYLAIAMLPCTMLWRWMADKLYNLVPENSAYYQWFEENKSPEPGYQGSLERFVDEHFTTEQEYEEAKPIFCQAMVGECDFFHEGGQQSRCEIPAECLLTG